MRINIVGTVVGKRPRVFVANIKNGGSHWSRLSIGSRIIIETRDKRLLTWFASTYRDDMNVGDEVSCTATLGKQHENLWSFIKNPRGIKVTSVQERVKRAKTKKEMKELLHFLTHPREIAYYDEKSSHPADIAREAIRQLGDMKDEERYAETLYQVPEVL